MNARLTVETIENAALVPNAAILRGTPGTYVYLMDGDDKVTVRPIKTGETDGTRTVVLSGLNPGDRVVTDGTDRLREGASVRVVGHAAGPQAGAPASGAPGGTAGSAAPGAPPRPPPAPRRTRPARPRAAASAEAAGGSSDGHVGARAQTHARLRGGGSLRSRRRGDWVRRQRP